MKITPEELNAMAALWFAELPDDIDAMMCAVRSRGEMHIVVGGTIERSDLDLFMSQLHEILVKTLNKPNVH